MAVSLVNKTIYNNSGGATSGTINLSAASTAGNWLLLEVAAEAIVTFTTDQAENIPRIQTGPGTVDTAVSFYLLQSIHSCASINFTVGLSRKIYFAAIYELSGSSLSSTLSSVQTASSSSSLVGPSIVGPVSGTAFYASGCACGNFGGSTISVSAGWTLDTITFLSGNNGAGSAYQLGNGTKQATFTLNSNNGVIQASGIVVFESAPSLIPTVTSITSNPNPSAQGVNVVFSVGINGAGTTSPTGTVTFNIDGSNVATVPALFGGIGMATAVFQTSTLAIGSHPAFAVYSGDSTYSGSTSPTIIQVVVAPLPAIGQQEQKDFGNSTADVIWWHTGFTGYDEETLGMEGLINEGGTPNIPWLLGLAVSQGNGVTEALAHSNILYFEPEFGNEGGGGGNESGASEFGGAQSGGLIVSW